MDALKCNRCGAPRDQADNFCRRCGHEQTIEVPAVRGPALPAPLPRPIPPEVVGSVVMLAVGTGLEWLARRMARGAVRAAGRAIVRDDKPVKASNAQGDVVVDEMIYVRRILRR